jgi:hypothetical protein
MDFVHAQLATAPSRVHFLTAMLRHVLKLVLGPGRDRMDLAILITHEVKVRQWNRNRIGANSEKPADVDDRLAAGIVDVRAACGLVQDLRLLIF